MQPSATASIPPNADMDLQTVQSMDWLFKKERFYLLVQFWQQRATLAEKEVTTLKEQIANNTTNNCENKEGSNMDRQTFENEIAAKDKEINQLVEEVQRLQSTISKLKETSISQITSLENQLEQKRQIIGKLEAKLDHQRDYEDMKRELSILRSDLSNNPETTKSIDLLLEKTKNLQQSENRVKTPTQEVEGVAINPPNQPAEALSPLSPQGPLPRPFQNVETFGSMLGEEIVANWRRSIEQNNRLISRSPCIDVAKTPTSVMGVPDASVTPTNNEKSTASTPQPPDSQPPQSSPVEPILNGNPKSPEDNNNHHVSNNNIPMATMCAVNNFLRGEEALKSPYRFEDHRSPFRFAEELGMAPGSMVSRLGESLIPKGDPMEAKLQEMLRYNMDKYASQNLDTLHISRRVRELLSIHNIGQRLFAKYILGLSQGTVSELLSKPKPWDKLTEKGRDSYRKMHAWACDEQAILLLKSLIPKKDNFSSGKDTGMPTFGRPENDLTEERIAHILSEASQFQQMKTHTEDSHSNDDSKSPHNQCLSPFSKDSSQNRRLKKYENDDIPQEKVVRIYQEELAKLMGRRVEDMRNPREAFPGMFFPQLFSGGQMDRTQEEIRMALDAYHREILKLNQSNPGQMPNLGLLALQHQALVQHQPNGGVQDLSLPKDKKLMNGEEKDTKDSPNEDALRHSGSAFSLVRPKIEPGTQPSSGSTASSPLGNAILPPAMTPTDDFSGSAVASPLQRMASITNSLISQPPAQPHHTTTQRPLKAVLPPITQQQFDQYNNLNTEDIVKKVKEQLSQYSISQRLFGESVLGLSQGSVSDLLARPKPWHMLTQKGREPFIRMKMFLEDDNAVHKLVASQYKIAPEKLMRTGGYGGAGTSIGKPMPPTPKMLNDAAGIISKMQETQNLLPPSLQLGPPPMSQNPQPPPMLLTPPGVPPHHAISLQNPDHLKKNPSPHGIPHSPMGQHQSLRNMHQHMSPSVYEMAALTQDLDTQVITTKIKEALLANNIGQKDASFFFADLRRGSPGALPRFRQRAAFQTQALAYAQHQRARTLHPHATLVERRPQHRPPAGAQERTSRGQQATSLVRSRRTRQQFGHLVERHLRILPFQLARAWAHQEATRALLRGTEGSASASLRPRPLP
ncbi:homeobox protein cut isoform X8 [Zophobas morio]|uniref:homeobox protein cut isoform X8 n=1 Tax=Zophobas morio TaxID=2755281 RepID=UPI00308386CD